MVVNWRMAILSPDQTVPFWIEVQDDELLDTFVSLRCWFESYDDTIKTVSQMKVSMLNHCSF